MTPLVLCVLAADPWAAAMAEREPPADLAAEVRGVLDAKAVEVRDGGELAMTVWFRQTLPLEASAEVIANGVGYRELPAGALVAAVKLHRPFTDFRKQRVAAGVYTLRFAVQPEVGDHAGTSPHPEFLLLSPGADDPSPAVVEQPDLLKRSRTAAGGDHPAVMLLVPAGRAGEGPKVVERSGGLRVLLVRRVAEAGEAKAPLNLGLVVAGSSPTR